MNNDNKGTRVSNQSGPVWSAGGKNARLRKSRMASASRACLSSPGRGGKRNGDATSIGGSIT